ncbi:MAG: DUF502 domain-containing protein [Emcibacter sp.]|nr:DUF502 domain-containing protein [Emcibacter sp.]
MKTYFLTGLVVASPVGITIYIALAFIDLIDRNIIPLIPAAYNPETYLPFPLPGIGLVFLFFMLTTLGFLAANFLGRYLISIGERMLNRMPIVRSVYNTLKQIFETVISENKGSFQKVVLLEYPRKGLWAIAFISGENTGEIQEKMADDVVNVFLPTTPNPTSGFLLFVPKKDIIYLDMTPDQGAKYVISAGLVDPSNLPVKEDKK